MSCSLTMEDHLEVLSVRGYWPGHLVTATGLFSFSTICGYNKHYLQTMLLVSVFLQPVMGKESYLVFLINIAGSSNVIIDKGGDWDA